MQIHSIIMTLGLVLMVLSCLVAAIMQIKKKVQFGPKKSIFAPLTKHELKIMIYAGIGFLVGLILLFVGGYIEINA